MPELVFDEGVPVDAICNRCQIPGASIRSFDGECYHTDCAPDRILSRRE